MILVSTKNKANVEKALSAFMEMTTNEVRACALQCHVDKQFQRTKDLTFANPQTDSLSRLRIFASEEKHTCDNASALEKLATWCLVL